MNNAIDHLSVGAASLEQGVTFLKDALGVEMPRGSKHPMMATHNCVMQAGHESFLELIAIDPDGETPSRRRWFSFDEPATQSRLAERPRPLCWVVRTDSLDAIVKASPVDLGEIVKFQRGDRSWRLTVPADGHLPEQGLLPAFIEWSPGPHPSVNQQDLGIRRRRVILTSPEPDRLLQMLRTLQIESLAEVREGPHHLAFELETARGPVTLT
jgi:hypothetical protein